MLIRVVIFIILIITSYNIIKPETIGGYILIPIVAGLISIAMTLAFIAILALLGLISKLFIRE